MEVFYSGFWWSSTQMIMRAMIVMACFWLSNGVLSKEIVLGVEFKPQRKWALAMTPLVLTDPFSVKLALEYRVHPNISLVVPLEGKWMDYRWAIKGVTNLFGIKGTFPEDFYNDNRAVRLGWNVNYSHLHVSSGLGMKYIPFSESMQEGFFIKAQQLIGIERFNAFHAEGVKMSAILISAVTLGYTWIAGDVFTYGIEGGAEWVHHTNPVEKMLNPFFGFAPIAQASLGLTF